MAPVKVVVLGGSGVATPALAQAIVQRSGRTVPIELVLAGRSREKLELVAGISRLVSCNDPLLAVSQTTDLAQALDGAQYVINQVRVGGLEARAFDESFPNDLGLPGEETVGPGGFANASRTIPVVLEYARQIEKLAPDALLLSFANPASLVQYAITRYTRTHTIGLCDGPITLSGRIAKALGAPVEELTINYVGMHHFGWVTGVWWQGRDVLADVLANAAVAAPDVEPAIVRSIGAVPGLYLNYVFHADRMLAAKLQARKAGKRSRAEELLDLQDDLLAEYRQALAVGKEPAGLARRGARWYSAIIAPVLLALIEQETAKITINVTNGQTVPWLPADAIVEVPCLVEHGKVQPLATGPVPPDVKALLLANCTYEMLAAEAIAERDRAKALRALLINPMIRNYEQATQTLERAWAGPQKG